MSFAENGAYFVTVGNRHVKFWYFDTEVGSKVTFYTRFHYFIFHFHLLEKLSHLSYIAIFYLVIFKFVILYVS